MVATTEQHEQRVGCQRQPVQPAVLHITSAVGRCSFGVGAVVQELCRAQHELGSRAVMWTNDSPDEAASILQQLELAPEHLVTFPVRGPQRLAYSPAMERAAAGDLDEFSGVTHVHGVWIACVRAAIRQHQMNGRPLIVSAQGSLDQWARQRSRLKKWLAFQMYGRELLRRATCLNAVGANEVAAYRNFGLRHPIALIPNGVSEMWLNSVGNAEAFRHRFGIPRDTRLLLYLSRVTPKKGIPLLLKAIGAHRGKMAESLLLVAGPDEFDHTRELVAQAEQLGIRKLVRFLGPLYGQTRRDAFEAADAFVLPTYSEGNPLAVLEALGAGLPVLTTRGAPCEYLAEHDCGWWTEIDCTSIAAGLDELLSSDATRLQQMGTRGREVVRRRFTWTHVAEKMLQTYQWMLGDRSRPDFVLCD